MLAVPPTPVQPDPAHRVRFDGPVGFRKRVVAAPVKPNVSRCGIAEAWPGLNASRRRRGRRTGEAERAQARCRGSMRELNEIGCDVSAS
jgi:hypothetical protein